MKRVNAELLTKTKDIVHLGDYSIDFLLEHVGCDKSKPCSGLVAFTTCGSFIDCSQCCFGAHNSNPNAREFLESLKIKKDDLIEEAKKRYPVGTRFIPVHLTESSSYCIVTNDKFIKNGGSVYALTDENDLYSPNPKYGNKNSYYNRLIYHHGKFRKSCRKSYGIPSNQ